MQNAEVEQLARCQTYFSQIRQFFFNLILSRLRSDHFCVAGNIQNFNASRNYVKLDAFGLFSQNVIEFRIVGFRFDQNKNIERHWE